MKRAESKARLAATRRQTVTAANTAGTESPVNTDDLLGAAGVTSEDGAGSGSEEPFPRLHNSEESSDDERGDRGSERAAVGDGPVLSLEDLEGALDNASENLSRTNGFMEAFSPRKERSQSPDSVVEIIAAAPVASRPAGSSKLPSSSGKTSTAVSAKIIPDEEVRADVYCAACRRYLKQVLTTVCVESTV